MSLTKVEYGDSFERKGRQGFVDVAKEVKDPLTGAIQ
jgi:hypothetical protein